MEGKDVTVIANGLLVAQAILAAESLESEGISVRVIDMHTVKPIDRQAIERAAAETGAIVVAEEHLVDGGLGVRVAQVVAETQPCPMEFVGIQETYAESGQPEELLEKYGLVAQKRGGRGAESRRTEEVRSSRPWSAPMADASLLRSIPRAERGVSLDRRPGGVFQRIYGDPSPIFGKAAGDLIGPQLRRSRSAPEQCAAWQDRFARALDGEIAAAPRALRRRDVADFRFPDPRRKARFDMPAATASETTAWSTAEQELRYTVLGALKAMEFERKSLRDFCTIPSGRI